MRKISCCLLGITTLLVHALGCSHTEGTGPVYDEVSTGTDTSTSAGAGGGCATSPGVSGSSASSTGTGGAGGRACIAPTNGCGGPDQCGPTLPIVQIKQNAPAPLGGVVEDGTYWYTSFTMYFDPGTPPQDYSGYGYGGTFVISGGAVHQSLTNVVPGSPAETKGSSGTFGTSANLFTMDLTCGDNLGVSQGSYTVNGKTLTLLYALDPSVSVAIVLTKQ